MKTKRVTLKELKELKEFTGVNRRGVLAQFIVDGDSAVAKFENGETRELKLDSVRRSWLLVVQEDKVENKEENKVEEIKVGYKVRDSKTDKVGVVTGIQGRLVTIENSKGDFPADIDNLEIVSKDNAEEKKEDNVVDLNGSDKPETSKKNEKSGQKRRSTADNFTAPEELVNKLDLEQTGIVLVNHESSVAVKNEHTVTDFQIEGKLLRIYKVAGYTTEVTLYTQDGELEHTAERMSLKSMLEYLKYSETQIRETGRIIRRLSKDLG